METTVEELPGFLRGSARFLLLYEDRAALREGRVAEVLERLLARVRRRSRYSLILSAFNVGLYAILLFLSRDMGRIGGMSPVVYRGLYVLIMLVLAISQVFVQRGFRRTRLELEAARAQSDEGRPTGPR